MCEINFDGSCDVWRETEQVARKQHKCSCCDAVILPGERYRRIFVVADGNADGEKACSACAAASDRFADAHDGRSALPSFMPEMLRHCIDEEGQHSESGQRWLGELAAIVDRSKLAKVSATPGAIA